VKTSGRSNCFPSMTAKATPAQPETLRRGHKGVHAREVLSLRERVEAVDYGLADRIIETHELTRARTGFNGSGS
jgi:hypothetical protein